MTKKDKKNQLKGLEDRVANLEDLLKAESPEGWKSRVHEYNDILKLQTNQLSALDQRTDDYYQVRNQVFINEKLTKDLHQWLVALEEEKNKKAEAAVKNIPIPNAETEAKKED